MKKTIYLRRSVVAIGLALATVMAMANPAGAAVHDSTVDGGTLTSTKTGATPESFTLGSTTSCTGTTLTADLGTEVGSGNAAVTALNSSHVTTFTTGSYLVVLTRSTTGNSAGHWTLGSGLTAPHAFESSRIAIVITIYNSTTCTPGTVACTVAVLLHVNITFPASIAAGTPWAITVLTSIGNVVAFPTCTAGPSQILGMTVTATSTVTGTLTT